MTTPSGQISLSDVNIEMGLSSTTNISMDSAAVRQIAGITSGAIGMANLRSKQYGFYFYKNIASNTANVDIWDDAVLAGWNQDIPLRASIYINIGVIVYSTSTATPALLIENLPTGSTVYLTNNGEIQGQGGTGGAFASLFTYNNGESGGPAISTTHSMTINNQSGYIGGGGGGGGAAGYPSQSSNGYSSGVGGAGGAGGGKSGSRPGPKGADADTRTVAPYDAGGVAGSIYAFSANGGRRIQGAVNATPSVSTYSSSSLYYDTTVSGTSYAGGAGASGGERSSDGSTKWGYACGGGGGWGQTGGFGANGSGTNLATTITGGIGSAYTTGGGGAIPAGGLQCSSGGAGGAAILKYSGATITWVNGTASTAGRVYGAY